RLAARSEEAVCGPLPAAEVLLTHDVDAIRKTMAIRFKQAAFHAFNAVRRLADGRMESAARKAKDALRCLVSADAYWCFERIVGLEEAQGLRSHFNVYAGGSSWLRGVRSLLIDPGYAPEEPRLQDRLRDLAERGWTVGLHPSFGAWAD